MSHNDNEKEMCQTAIFKSRCDLEYGKIESLVTFTFPSGEKSNYVCDPHLTMVLLNKIREFNEVKLRKINSLECETFFKN